VIENPEATTIARQIRETLTGKRIAEAVRGNAPHKFAFYTGTPEEYARMLEGRTIGPAWADGTCILVPAEPGYVLVLGGGGERIAYHTDDRTLPAKHHLMLRFGDGTALSVSVQGWGAAQMYARDALAEAFWGGLGRIQPQDEAFTPAYFEALFAALPAGDPASVKHFIISKPGVPGVGNGYLQDILFAARLHPRRRAHSLTAEERAALYAATRDTLRRATGLCGRDSERDLFGHPGGYRRIMDKSAIGQPCIACGTRVEKFAFLGGACTVCPQCQPL
jgi:formamidopyrimidine-DNA glycosylase